MLLAPVTHSLLSSIVDAIDNYTNEARADARSNEDSKILNPSLPAEHARAVEHLDYTPGNIIELQARVNAARDLLEDSVNVPIHARHHITFTGRT